MARHSTRNAQSPSQQIFAPLLLAKRSLSDGGKESNLALETLIPKSKPMPLDTTHYYRLTNNYLGANSALDVTPNGSGRLMMAAVGAFSGQYWRPVDLGGGKYAFRTLYLGDNLSLDIINDGVNTTPWLAETGNYSGQSWSIAEWGDGTCKLTNDASMVGTGIRTSGSTNQEKSTCRRQPQPGTKPLAHSPPAMVFP